jgi:hypothetical protein
MIDSRGSVSTGPRARLSRVAARPQVRLRLRAALFVDAYRNARAWRKPVRPSLRHALATARRGHGRLTEQEGKR